MLSAPQQQQNVIEQTQQAIANAQQQAAAAVSDVNQKFLEATGVKSNVDLLNSVQVQAQSYATQIKGDYCRHCYQIYKLTFAQFPNRSN